MTENAILVPSLASRKTYRRGYPVALLVGLDQDRAAGWRVFSNVAKPDKTLKMEGSRSDPKALYNFHEAVVNALRPAMKEGVKSIVLACPARTSYAQDFLKHVKDHHQWLLQGAAKASFVEVTGAAVTSHEITELTRTPAFRQVVSEATADETENLLNTLEKKLNATSTEQLVLYSLDEIESAICSPWVVGKPKPEMIVIADTYFSVSRQRNRLQRLQQIAINRGVKIRVVSSKSAAGKRVLQFGGLICLLSA